MITGPALDESKLMEPTAIIQLGMALAAVAAAIIGFNALVGKGPRGTVWIVAACLFTWAAMLPIVLRDPDDFTLTPKLDLFIAVLRLSGLIGFVLGIVDVLQTRGSDERQPIAEWALRQPVVWGTVVCANFYALLYLGTIESPLLWRYMAGHPVEIVEAAFFFVGMATLLLRLVDLARQKRLLGLAALSPMPLGGQAVDDCPGLLAQLAALPGQVQQTYLVRRLREAIRFVQRKGSADNLDQHLRHLEELDAIHMHAGYASLRIIIWAIPILGFLGTVIGITVAIANLSPEALERSMSEVTQGLGVAFDTTAEALALTMILMFAKTLVEKVDNRLLAAVDARVSEELVGRFQETAVGNDPNVAVIRRMSQQVVEAVESLAARQADVWKSSIDETNEHWASVATTTATVVRESLSAAMRENLDRHAKLVADSASKHAERLTASAVQHAERLDNSAHSTIGHLREGLEKLAELLVEALHRHGEVLTAGEKELAGENRQHLSEVQAALGQSMVIAAERQEHLVRQSEHLLKEMQIALVEAAGATMRQQEELVRQGDVLLKVVDATGQIKKLEEVLGQNLAAVHHAGSFEEMVLNLSAAIQLLCARLGHAAFSDRDPQIAGDASASQAA